MLEKIQLPNKVYDVLKIVSLIVLPLSEFIGTLGGIWGLPYCEKIVQTLIALNTFLGAVLAISSANYKRANYTILPPDIDESEAEG